MTKSDEKLRGFWDFLKYRQKKVREYKENFLKNIFLKLAEFDKEVAE